MFLLLVLFLLLVVGGVGMGNQLDYHLGTVNFVPCRGAPLPTPSRQSLTLFPSAPLGPEAAELASSLLPSSSISSPSPSPSPFLSLAFSHPPPQPTNTPLPAVMGLGGAWEIGGTATHWTLLARQEVAAPPGLFFPTEVSTSNTTGSQGRGSASQLPSSVCSCLLQRTAPSCVMTTRDVGAASLEWR
jgi:hypothetical protein